MKFLLYTLLIASLLTGCSAPKLYQQGVKKINKAIIKDPSIRLPADTITTTITEIKIDTVDNEIIKTITNNIITVIDTCEFDEDLLKTTKQLRLERKILKDSLSHAERMYKLETRRLKDSLVAQRWQHNVELKKLRSSNATEKDIAKIEHKSSPFLRFVGRIWWLFLILGIILGLYLRGLLGNISIINPFKKN